MPIMIFMTRYYHSSKNTCRPVSVHPNPFKLIHLTFFIIVFLLVSSCEKGPTTIGERSLPAGDFVLINAIDTFAVYSYTLYDDKVETDNQGYSYVGQIYDPYFGTTDAEFVSQIRLQTRWDGHPFIIDSVTMNLKFLGVKSGTLDIPHFMRISEISDIISPDSAYFSNTSVPTTGFKMEIELPKLKPDTINDVQFNLTNIPFGTGNNTYNNLGAYLTRDTSKLFYSLNMVHYNPAKPDFRDFFRGLYFQILPSSDPLLATLGLVNDQSGFYNNYIVIYMHEPGDTIGKSYSFVFDATNRNAFFNRFSHDFSTATAGRNLAEIINVETKPTAADTLSYLQYLDGVYTKLSIPGLETFKNTIRNNPTMKNIAVNKAHLIVPFKLDGNLYTKKTIPYSLLLRYKNKEGVKVIVPDYTISSAFLGGLADTTSAFVYNFNIPAFVQAYLNDTITNTIKPEVEIFQNAGIRNVILKANGNKNPVKFEFTYTKF
jgi:hypothetical protein